MRYPASEKLEIKPRLLSDNGASYISGELAEHIRDNDMSHVRVVRRIIRKRSPMVPKRDSRTILHRVESV